MKKLLTIAALAFVLTSCGNAPQASTASDTCIMKTSRPAKITATYDGTEVGFCCKKCKGAFEAMSTSDQAAKISAMMK